MIIPSHSSFVPLFHSLENGTVEQTLNHRNSPRNIGGTFSLKVLANKVLERNKQGNKPGTAASKSVSSPDQPVPLCGTKHKEIVFPEEKETSTDNADRFKLDVNMSVLSVPSADLFDKESLLYDYEERLAIAEYDGQQNPLEAERIAYHDAFMAVLNTLPHDEEGVHYGEDWLTRRIKAAQSWLVAQGIQQPE